MYILGPDPQDFPALHAITGEPDGLIAIGGDLEPERIIAAYRRGIFPWFDDDRLPMWWSPDPRLVLCPDEVRISRSLRRRLQRNDYEVHFDRSFEAVISACAAPREADGGTWITAGMNRAYARLHELGVAHSAETWIDGQLAGGLYGISIGRVFFGESMFTRVTDASKIAFVHLCRQLNAWDFAMIDCQVHSDHLQRLGGRLIDRHDFVRQLEALCSEPDAWGGMTAGTRERSA